MNSLEFINISKSSSMAMPISMECCTPQFWVQSSVIFHSCLWRLPSGSSLHLLRISLENPCQTQWPSACWTQSSTSVLPDLPAAHRNILHTMKGRGRLSEFHLCSTDSSASFQRGPTASSGLSAIQESWKVGMDFLALPLAVVSPPSPLLEPGYCVLLQIVYSLLP